MEEEKKYKILIVDDEPDNLALLYRTLRGKYDITKASSAVEALEILKNQLHPVFYLTFLIDFCNMVFQSAARNIKSTADFSICFTFYYQLPYFFFPLA